MTDTPVKILVVEDEMLIGAKNLHAAHQHGLRGGKHTGDFFGIPPTGKTVSVQGATIALMPGGIILEGQDFFDNLDPLTQPGLYPWLLLLRICVNAVWL